MNEYRLEILMRALEMSINSRNREQRWKAVIRKEQDVLITNETWELIPRCAKDKEINCIWLFKVKEKADDSVKQLKARLVANGTNQIEVQDYNETFRPIVMAMSIRMVLSILVSKGWKLAQIDVGNVFLLGNLQE